MSGLPANRINFTKIMPRMSLPAAWAWAGLCHQLQNSEPDDIFFHFLTGVADLLIFRHVTSSLNQNSHSVKDQCITLYLV